jgi:hypothetical protein
MPPVAEVFNGVEKPSDPIASRFPVSQSLQSIDQGCIWMLAFEPGSIFLCGDLGFELDEVFDRPKQRVDSSIFFRLRAEKAAANHAPSESTKRQGSSPDSSMSRGIITTVHIIVAGGHPSPTRSGTPAPQPSACFTRSGVIGVCRRRTPASSATALAIAGATSGVAIWPTPVGWLLVGTTSMNISGISFMRGT